MTTSLPIELMDVRVNDGVTVVRFLRRTILDPLAIEAIGERLNEALAGQAAPRVLIDFSRVESVTSAMIGRFLTLHQQVEAAGGRLAFCGVGPFLQQIFALCGIPAGIPVHADEATATASLRAD
jgi:anti-anti-sigma factor